LRIAWDIALPTILFVPVSAVIMSWTPITALFTSTNLNGIIGWLTTLGLISLVLLAVRINKAKKAGTTIPLSDLALGGMAETTLNRERVIKSILMGSLVVAMVLIWLAAIEGFAGVNYQFWNIVTMNRVNHSRFIRAIPYIVMIFFTMITGCMGMLVTRRLPESGNEQRDMVTAVVVNLLIAAAPLAILLIAQYGGSLIVGTGATILPQLRGGSGGTSTGALDFSFGYCWMMGTMNAVITYLYRKTGAAWPGIIMCSMYAGFITVAAFTLVH
jgi:hypothetical protein